MNADTDYLYINHRQGTVPTGIRLVIAAPLTIGGLILLYLAYYLLFHLDKQRNILYNEENDYVTFTGGRYE